MIFESNTPAGKAFDVALLLLIFASVVVVLFDSLQGNDQRYAKTFDVLIAGATRELAGEELPPAGTITVRGRIGTVETFGLS